MSYIIHLQYQLSSFINALCFFVFYRNLLAILWFLVYILCAYFIVFDIRYINLFRNCFSKKLSSSLQEFIVILFINDKMLKTTTKSFPALSTYECWFFNLRNAMRFITMTVDVECKDPRRSGTIRDHIAQIPNDRRWSPIPL